MEEINSFLKSNISIAMTYEEEKMDRNSIGKIQAFKAVLELIRIWEEDNK